MVLLKRNAGLHRKSDNTEWLFPRFHNEILTWRKHYFYLLCYIARKLNIYGLLSPYLHTMCFISVGYSFSGAVLFFLFFCYHANSLTSKFKCAVEFQVSTWHFSAEWNKHKLCKVSSLSDLCTLDIWKWVHCHVMSLSKDSIWWIFHPSCLQNLFCMHTDVHCIKTLSWPAVFLV